MAEINEAQAEETPVVNFTLSNLILGSAALIKRMQTAGKMNAAEALDLYKFETSMYFTYYGGKPSGGIDGETISGGITADDSGGDSPTE